MKIMILSDSHMMERAELLDLLKENSVDYYIHCGDIFMDYDGLPLNNFYLVRGNNDYGKIPDVITPTFDNLKFFVTHGHRYSVGYNLNNLYQEGKKMVLMLFVMAILIDHFLIKSMILLSLTLVVFISLGDNIVILLTVFLILQRNKLSSMMF